MYAEQPNEFRTEIEADERRLYLSYDDAGDFMKFFLKKKRNEILLAMDKE